VRDGTFPVHDENGKAIFREKATNDYYIFLMESRRYHRSHKKLRAVTTVYN
jgi:hypothetical protein